LASLLSFFGRLQRVGCRLGTEPAEAVVGHGVSVLSIEAISEGRMKESARLLGVLLPSASNAWTTSRTNNPGLAVVVARL
jgi:hypothetical protein